MYKRKATTAELTDTPTPSRRLSLEPWQLVFNDARQAFSQQQFKEAVALFSRSLSLNPNHVTVLDCRAACYEKLGQLELAYKDASASVKAAPKDARGYLRAGKILSLQKKSGQALLIYNKALKKVDPKDARYALLHSMKDTAEKSMRLPVSMDMMAKLPYDVISLVFSYLTFDRRVQCTAVSKSWRGFALNWSGMWRDLDFDNRKVSLNVIKRYLGYAQGRHVRSFSIHHANRNSLKNILQTLIDENCQYIESLDLKGCDIPLDIFVRMLRLVGKHVKHLRIDHSNITDSELLEAVIPMCPQLTHLSIFGISEGRPYAKETHPELEKLTFLRCNPSSIRVLQLAKHLTCLEFYTNTMHYIDLSRLISTTHTKLQNVQFSYGHAGEKIPWEPKNTHYKPSAEPGIKTFGIYEDRFFASPMLEQVLVQNRHLQHLTLFGCDLHALTGLVSYLRQSTLPRLKQVDLQNCHTITEEELDIIISTVPTLEKVFIPRMIAVSDATLAKFATHTHKLTLLDISDCNNVTGVGLQTLVRAQGLNLEKLVLNNCQRISPDAVHWARTQLKQGVVECKFRTK